MMFTKDLDVGSYIWRPCVIEEDGRIKRKTLRHETRETNEGEHIYVYRALLSQPNTGLNRADAPLWLATSSDEQGIVVFCKELADWIALKIITKGRNCVYAVPIRGTLEVLRQITEGQLQENEAEEAIRNNRIGLAELLDENVDLRTELNKYRGRVKDAEDKYVKLKVTAENNRLTEEVIININKQSAHIKKIINTGCTYNELVCVIEKLLIFIERLQE